MSKGLLITGATGKQGSAVVDALLASSSGSDSSDVTILAVTRNPSSAAAQKLASKSPLIKIVQGDLNDLPNLFTNALNQHKPIWGVYSVQIPAGQGQSASAEEAQGKGLVDESLKHGVKQFVYSSVERGGNDKSYDNPTDVPHFITKYNIEHHLVDRTKGTDMRYTILRPVAFMENLVPAFSAKVFGASWKATLPADKGLQFVSTADIGHFAAAAFRNPERFRDRGISLAGDEVTFAQADKLFKEKAGQPMPETFSIFGHALNYFVADFGRMMNWFATEGFGTDIKALRQEHPGLLTFGQWLETKSAWAKK